MMLARKAAMGVDAVYAANLRVDSSPAVGIARQFLNELGVGQFVIDDQGRTIKAFTNRTIGGKDTGEFNNFNGNASLYNDLTSQSFAFKNLGGVNLVGNNPSAAVLNNFLVRQSQAQARQWQGIGLMVGGPLLGRAVIGFGGALLSAYRAGGLLYAGSVGTIMTAELVTDGAIAAGPLLASGKLVQTVISAEAKIASAETKIVIGEAKAVDSARVSSKPEWLRRLDEGNAFNAERAAAYPYNEVYINNPKGAGYTRLDSYNPTTGEIVSRKFTQLSEVQEKTALSYINEIPAKYPVNGTIANVPSSGALAGRPLLGQYILEVPVQVRPIPQSVLNAADRAGVLIRDINGKVH